MRLSQVIGSISGAKIVSFYTLALATQPVPHEEKLGNNNRKKTEEKEETSLVYPVRELSLFCVGIRVFDTTTGQRKEKSR